MTKKIRKQKSADSWKNQVIRTTYRNTSKKEKKRPWKKKLFFAILWFILFIIVAVVIFVAWISRDLPNPNQLLEREITQSTKIYDRTGEHILYEIHGDEKRTLISLADLPDYVKWASISIEDKNFYNHSGFSVWAMFRTAITNVIYNRSAGGSTLTQQFVKNAVLTPEKKITRKIKEIVLAYRLEKKFSKDEILQMYLNEIPYGSNAYGIEAASQKYFNKSAKDISIAEAALLAALVQAPSRYSPYGPNKDFLLGRKDYVITLMAEQGYISEEEAEQAKQEEIVFAGPETNITAPHFVMYIKDILAEKYGEKMIEQEGLKIYTTLDLYKQQIAEEVIKEKTVEYEEKYNANNAALVSIDPKTGQILAMVGSRDYFNNDIDGQVNVALRPRQPGSSLKPLVYATLFEKGYTPDTILYDVETNFSQTEPYRPKNYNLKENGPVSVRKALAGSLNIPAVKALYLAGINDVLNLAEKAGYTTLYPRDRFGLALVLGGAEVKLLEHVNAYSVFAREGKVNNIVSILKIEDKEGNIIEEYKSEEKNVLGVQTSRMINNILSDNSARAYAFGERNDLVISGRSVAVKTGTTNDYRDAWTIGYTPSIVTGVWVGNNNDDEMKRGAGGSTVAAPIWNAFMSRVLGDTPVENFKAPDDYKTGKGILDGEIPEREVKIDITTGELASGSTPPELISSLKIPEVHSILFYVNKDDPRGEAPKDPSVDPQFELWESAVLAWAEKNATSTKLLKDFDKLHSPENIPEIKIISPYNNQDIFDDNLTVEVAASAPRGINQINYFINGSLWQTKNSNELLNEKLPPLDKGYHNLLVRACDDVNNCAEDSLDFNLKNKTIKNNESSTVAIISPSSGIAVNQIDFPLNISVGVSNPDNISRILIFLSKEDGSDSKLLGDINGVNGEIFEVYWQTELADKGVYKVYAEIKTWSGETKKSNEIIITVS
ncbi:MAG: penicillin-binding protein [Patescibacteria group bacterium]|nr:penicillin-binding protein [Patescibacteria group bacterium]